MIRSILCSVVLATGVFTATLGAAQETATPGLGLGVDRITFPLASRHVNIDPTNFGRAAWNELNPGVLLTYADRGRLGLDYTFGGFINSYDDFSIYAGVGKEWIIAGDLTFGATIGVANYHDNARLIATQIGDSDFIVTGGPTMGYRNLFVQIQPAGRQAGGGYGAVVVTGVTFPLGK